MRLITYIIINLAALGSLFTMKCHAQINADQVLRVGQSSLYLEDYVLAIQYFNQVAAARPYWAQPYFYRAIAKLSLDDLIGAEADATLAIERNPFITGCYEVRGVARQNMGRHAEAVADYDKALEQLPENRNLLFNKALAQQDMNDFEGAEATFNTLLRAYPRYDNGYVGRGRLLLEKGDTVAAMADIDKALQLNKNATNAYVLRSEIAIKTHGDYQAALADMDEAIKLQPRATPFFINRAFLRYNLNDYFGAMADYDYAIQLDPLNTAALFNRGLLRAEVHDNNKAIDDFTRVLDLDRNNFHALYNRAILRKEIADYRGAVDDIDRVIAAYPDFAGAIFLRSECKRMMGDMASAERDYRKSMALSRSASGGVPSDKEEADSMATRRETSEDVAARFTTLLTLENTADIKEEFHTPGLKGRVQDRNINVEIEPMFSLAFYMTTTEIKQSPYFIKEVDDLNSARVLRFVLMPTNHEPKLTDNEAIDRHFASIDYYNSYIGAHTPRAADFFGRAMDHYTLRNYDAATADFTHAIETAPDFTLAYFMRANSIYKGARSGAHDTDADSRQQMKIPGLPARQAPPTGIHEALADINRVIELSPRMAFARFNKGNLLFESGDLTSAIAAYTDAIELKPDFGEAYYNRGYIYLKLGNREAGVADLSKAGELGVVPSYNLLKRMR